MELDKTLLSQKEIDTLVRFLLDQKTSIDREVMSQENIDKLIYLLQSSNHLRLRYDTPAVAPDDHTEAGIFKLPKLAPDETPLLRCAYSEDGFLTLYADTEAETYQITPRMVQEARYLPNDTSVWGCCIPPSVFHRIAGLLNARFTQETFTSVCRSFAKTVYLDENAELPDFYLPFGETLAETLI